MLKDKRKVGRSVKDRGGDGSCKGEKQKTIIPSGKRNRRVWAGGTFVQPGETEMSKRGSQKSGKDVEEGKKKTV